MRAVARLKIFTLMCYFSRKYIMFEPAKKGTEKLCVTTLKNGAKLEEVIWALKNGMRNLANFDSTLENHKICSLLCSFWGKYIMLELKNFREVMCHDTEGWCNFKENLTGSLKNGIMNLINFHASSRKSQNLDFAEILLPKVENVLNEKVQTSYFSWHVRVIQRKSNSWEICIFCVIK